MAETTETTTTEEQKKAINLPDMKYVKKYFDNLFAEVTENINSLQTSVGSLQTSMNTANSDITKLKADTSLDKIYPVGSIYMSIREVDPSTIFGGKWDPWGAGKVPVGVDSFTSKQQLSVSGKTVAHGIKYYATGSSTVGTDVAAFRIESSLDGYDASITYNKTSGTFSWTIYGSGADQTVSAIIYYYKKKDVSDLDADFGTVENTGGEKVHTLTIDEMPNHKHDELYYMNAYEENPTSPRDKLSFSHDANAGYDYTGLCNSLIEPGYHIETGKTGGGQPHNNLQPYITCYMWKRVG